MTSQARTAKELRQELLDYLQREATRLFNQRRQIERDSVSPIESRASADCRLEFNTVCTIRDFLTNLELPQ